MGKKKDKKKDSLGWIPTRREFKGDKVLDRQLAEDAELDRK